MKLPGLKPELVAKKEKAANQARKNRRKGKRGEALVYHLLSEWYGVPESFYGSKGSGGTQRFGQAGDIGCPPSFTLCIEVKNSEAWSFNDFFNNKGVIWKYWEQCIKATKDYNDKLMTLKNRGTFKKRFPFLIFTQNRDKIYCMFERHNESYIYTIPANHILVTKDYENKDFYVCLFTEFLSLNKPENFL